MPSFRLLRTSTFRLALVHLCIFSVSAVVLLGLIYWSSAGFMARQTDATIETEARGLAEQYSQSGTVGLVRALMRRVAESRANRGLYLLVDGDGRPIAGNLSSWPRERVEAGGWITFQLEYASETGGEVDLGRAQVFELERGMRLLVGRDIRERLQLIDRVEKSLLWGFALTAALALVGGVLVSRRILSRIDAINRTSREIMAGDLARRIPVTGSRDEFDRLAESLNAMLDQIQRLIAGMRHVSDNIAHDLRGPLSRLRNRLEVTLMDQNDPGRYREAVERTIVEADALLKTFNALLSIAQAEAGVPRSRFEPVDLGHVLADVADLYGALAEEEGIALTLRSAPSTSVQGERHLLFQAISNLVDNALKFAPRGGHVWLEIRDEGREAVVVVADDGPGIPPEARERVLERFVRLDASRATPGSGLGLSLVAAVARLHGGAIEFDDNRPGLRARLRLPRAEPSAKPAPAPAGAGKSPPTVAAAPPAAAAGRESA
jgi:signal transduction histidine kinase